MRNVINTIANVTTLANPARKVMAGVDALRPAPHHLRLYAAPSCQRWASFAGKQKPTDQGSMPGRDLLSRSSRESSRRRRPRASGCLARS
jgi:hypothetical protein